jgi:hypothetical protein
MVNQVFTLRLNSTFAWVAPEPIMAFSGYKEINKVSEANARRSVVLPIRESGNFISGNKVISYLYQDPSQINNIITLAVPGLRGMIWEYRRSVVEAQRPAIEASIDRPLFEFYNIYDYSSVSETSRDDDLSQYQLIGKVSQFDVLHITVADYVAYINNNVPITITIPNSELVVELYYDTYDFWDEAYQTILNNI